MAAAKLHKFATFQ